MPIINIVGRNVNDALTAGLWQMKVNSKSYPSRNGPVLRANSPVCTTYLIPTERVVFEARRDANPVFHLMEALWMLAGKYDLAWLVQFNAKMADYGKNNVQWGAYGHRWWGFFGHNQIEAVIKELRARPDSRRAVIGMWDPTLDLIHGGVDVPCNTHIYFDIVDGALEMTVCCRSNDLLWGAYGANAVHFSVLQEVIAHELKVSVGEYRQFSNNFHIYTDLPMAQDFLLSPPDGDFNHYVSGQATVQPLLLAGETYAALQADCMQLVSPNGLTTWKTKFVREVAAPLRDSYLARKAGLPYTVPSGTVDWFVAYREWLDRRAK